MGLAGASMAWETIQQLPRITGGPLRVVSGRMGWCCKRNLNERYSGFVVCVLIACLGGRQGSNYYGTNPSGLSLRYPPHRDVGSMFQKPYLTHKAISGRHIIIQPTVDPRSTSSPSSPTLCCTNTAALDPRVNQTVTQDARHEPVT